jgi:hypothetical protein
MFDFGFENKISAFAEVRFFGFALFMNYLAKYFRIFEDFPGPSLL